MSTKQQLDTQATYRKQMEPALEKMIEDTIRDSALPNALAMVGVILGAFLLNLGVLILVTGG
jgi:hypothetical protein